MDPNCSVRRDKPNDALELCPWPDHQWIQIALYAETRGNKALEHDTRAPSMDPNCSVRRDVTAFVSLNDVALTINGSKLLCTQRPDTGRAAILKPVYPSMDPNCSVRRDLPLLNRARKAKPPINGSKLLCTQRLLAGKPFDLDDAGPSMDPNCSVRRDLTRACRIRIGR